MTILFPNSPLDPRRADPDFEAQFQAAREAGLDTLLLDSDALVQGDAERALRFVRRTDAPQVLAYRGWMLRPEAYAALYEALAERNWMLLTDAPSYEACHLLPGWYQLLQGRTPASVWLPIPECFDSALVAQAAALLGGALIVKDYVKSRKHEWKDACFISDALDVAEVERVTGNFLTRQAESLAGGLVLRRFVPLRQAGASAPGAAPVFNEWRLFCLRGFFIAAAPHASSSQGDFQAPPLEEFEGFEELAAAIPSPFFALDVAQKEDGGWIVLEVGDGGVSGLPPGLDAEEFYARLRDD